MAFFNVDYDGDTEANGEMQARARNFKERWREGAPKFSAPPRRFSGAGVYFAGIAKMRDNFQPVFSYIGFVFATVVTAGTPM